MALSYEELKGYENKKVQLLLKNSYRYKGTVKKVSKESFILIDKFNQLLTLLPEEISLVLEDKTAEVRDETKKRS